MENLNKLKLIPSLAAIAFCFSVSTSANADIALFEYAINIDGTVVDSGVPGDPTSGDSNPDGLDSEGLGTMTFNITGVGAHSFDAFFDHEIDEEINTFFNEVGSASAAPSAPAAGQSWEIDEPGFVFGDIYDNMLASTLDNANAVPAGLEDDVSMALGWDFTLADGELATIMLMLGIIDPGIDDQGLDTGLFRLKHTDPDSGPSFYLSSTLGISLSPIPVPAAIWLFGSGLVGLIGFSRRKAKA